MAIVALLSCIWWLLRPLFFDFVSFYLATERINPYFIWWFHIVFLCMATFALFFCLCRLWPAFFLGLATLVFFLVHVPLICIFCSWPLPSSFVSLIATFAFFCCLSPLSLFIFSVLSDYRLPFSFIWQLWTFFVLKAIYFCIWRILSPIFYINSFLFSKKIQ